MISKLINKERKVVKIITENTNTRKNYRTKTKRNNKPKVDKTNLNEQIACVRFRYINIEIFKVCDKKNTHLITCIKNVHISNKLHN